MVEVVRQLVEGAYAVIAIIAGQGMVAFMDGSGIRPLVLERRQTQAGISYTFASESRALDALGYELLHTLQVGETLFIDRDRKVHSR